MDCFVRDKSLYNENMRIKSWVGMGGSSDHLPILLNIDIDERNPPSSLKFNHTWLMELKFRELVINNWVHYENQTTTSKMKLFSNKINRIKLLIK